MPGTFFEQYTTLLLNLDTHPQFKPTLINTTHTSVHAPTMPITSLLYWEEAILQLKLSSVTAQKPPQML